MDNDREDHASVDDSDSDDADFVPNEPDSDLSEEEEEAPVENEKSKLNGKRKKEQKGKGKRKKRSESSDDDDDADDKDFIANGRSTKEVAEESVEVDEEEEKRKTDRLYSDFLTSVEEIAKQKKLDSNPETVATVKKVYDFAGERVEVEEKVTQAANKSNSMNALGKPGEDSANSATSSTSSTSGTNNSAHLPIRTRVSILSSNPAQIALGNKSGAKKGLSAILNAIQSNKKQKMGTLEKSKLDWQAFKKKEGIEEELQTHVKSKDGYVDRQEFLQRADLRQFEIEKNLRAKQRRNI